MFAICCFLFFVFNIEISFAQEDSPLSFGADFMSRYIKITDTYELPFQAQLITNPEAENIFCAFGISF